MKQSWSKEEIAAIASDITDEAIDENIEANPTLEGDEETLSSIGIKGTNYAVGGGSAINLYEHNIFIRRQVGGDDFKIYITFLDISSDAITKSGLLEKLSSNITLGSGKMVSGAKITSTTNQAICSLYIQNNSLYASNADSSFEICTTSNISSITLIDTITQII